MQGQSENDGNEFDGASVISDRLIDFAVLFMTDLHVGSERLHHRKYSKPLWLRYKIDNEMFERTYLSPLSWRAIMLFAMSSEKVVTIDEMDQPGRFRKLFPESLIAQLNQHAHRNANVPPVGRLYDPAGNAMLLLTRSRFSCHAVDALHNLTDGSPVFQPLWISDIMALRDRFGINLVRDETFVATKPIGTYLEAAAITGRMIDEAELSGIRLAGKTPRLPYPAPAPVAQKIFDHECREHPHLERLRGRTIYEDYQFTDTANFASEKVC